MPGSMPWRGGSCPSWLEARVNVNNITNKLYYDAIYRSASPFAYVAPGRSAVLTLTAKY